jgi:Leucine-rich repeat (LRR) protein
LNLRDNQLTSVPAEIGQLTSLERLDLDGNQLTTVPAEIGQLRSLKQLWLHGNALTSVPAAIRELEAAGCYVYLDDLDDDETRPRGAWLVGGSIVYYK